MLQKRSIPLQRTDSDALKTKFQLTELMDEGSTWHPVEQSSKLGKCYLKFSGLNPTKTNTTKEFGVVSNKLGSLADGTRHNVQPQLIY